MNKSQQLIAHAIEKVLDAFASETIEGLTLPLVDEDRATYLVESIIECLSSGR